MAGSLLRVPSGKWLRVNGSVIRAAAGDWVEPSSLHASKAGPLEPKDLEAWVPEQETFDPSKPCPPCGATSASYRDYETYCVCMACGRSFSL